MQKSEKTELKWVKRTVHGVQLLNNFELLTTQTQRTMRKLFLPALLAVTMITACSKDRLQPEATNNSTTSTPALPPAFYRYSGDDYSQRISKDSANKMIQSYLNSINYGTNDSTLRYLTFDADSMRNFLNDTSKGKIATIKFVVAHTLEYANSPKYGQDAKFRGEAITLVMVGLDENDQYIYTGDNKVYEHFRRCPSECLNQSATLD
ncbi:MAG: hypothetical protein EOO04_13330 [Chitinophagaceae bacterium]|nr:MAG: hypothetical protein EOO04_13330 [Chitinophagaceae bacterium]